MAGPNVGAEAIITPTPHYSNTPSRRRVGAAPALGAHPRMRLLGLRIDIDMARGLHVGVPRLVALLRELGIRASFFVPMGPDNSGRAIRRVVEARGFVRRMRRLRVVRRYGLSSLVRGVLLPAVPFGRARTALLALEQSGHEVGMHGHDHFRWQDRVSRADAGDVRGWVRQAADAYTSNLGHPPAMSAAPGWLCTDDSLEAQEPLRLTAASDVRGRGAFYPLVRGRVMLTPQLPTTLPCLEELLVDPALDAPEAVRHLVRCVAGQPFRLYTGHAELEGISLLESFRELLTQWMANGVRPVPLGTLWVSLCASTLPTCEVALSFFPGRSLPVAVQGPSRSCA
jgi:undecaprenyl phosphate-alpha-L-ara4FN deformylase